MNNQNENKNQKKKEPPKEMVQSIQLDLFSDFVKNDEDEVSNTVETWEGIPKYFLTPRQQGKLRTEYGHADPYKWDYSYRGDDYSVLIQPALIKQEDESYKAFFPWVTEELVEESLKRIFTRQQLGSHDPNKAESWVKFSLRMVQRDLKENGKARSLSEIKHAIQVMSRSILVLYKDGREVWEGSILQDLVTVEREDYFGDPDSLHAAKFPILISRCVNRLAYRQFNYKRLMSCKEQLSRWIYRRLISRFKQASLLETYNFMFSDLKGSGLLQQATEDRNRQKVVSALKELVGNRVILKYQVQEQLQGRKIIDVKYTLFSSIEFIAEQKAANKRAKNNLETIKKRLRK